ncbi:MAG: type I secretion C-terminal target domain-containing protein, partial [Rhodoferax sp.]|nr:type I secretion C-terminal target domain-containing protein [Rhodoferax sp.]
GVTSDITDTSVSYKVADSDGTTASAILSLTVTNVPVATQAYNDAGSAFEGHWAPSASTAYTTSVNGTAVTVTSIHDLSWIAPITAAGNVLTNDQGAEVGAVVTQVGGVAMTASGIDVAGTYGSLHVNADGSYLYTPNANDLTLEVTAKDSFSYSMSGGGSTSTANLEISVGNYKYVTSGNSSDNLLVGGAGADTLVGSTGHDVIIGGAGSDTLTGGTSAGTVETDVFKWSLADAGTSGSPAVDHIKDFGMGTIASGGDVLDLRDLLQGEHSAVAHGVSGALDTYLSFGVNGTNHNLELDISTTANGPVTQKIVFDNISGADVTAARDSLAGQLGMTLASGQHASDADLIKKLVDAGHLKTDV